MKEEIGDGEGRIMRKMRIEMEEGLRVEKRSLKKENEEVDIKFMDKERIGIDIDREIEEIR